ncbi:monovalent cation/H(+) antiporter subunit G [Coralloluteibacterium thermophilus]|uniref:Monovalent cation/H(+) antiporter subunit G n=1 Tax=Coralloluteibacterium thermophilum TaxID=2707049 RepID=A0ABV9NNJ8_9GAMM
MSWLAAPLLLAGAFFFLAGTVGLLRFPDAHSRLHALTKADNLGLGCLCAGLALLAGSWRTAALLLVVWLLALLAATVSAHLIARSALPGGEDGR